MKCCAEQMDKRAFAIALLAVGAAQAQPPLTTSLTPSASTIDVAPTKKDIMRAEKIAPRRFPPRGTKKVVSVVNPRTHEILPVIGDSWPNENEASQFLRCHFTDERAWVDPRLATVAVQAARAFGRDRVEIVSGYRAPKYNRILRKKGREVARNSMHMRGQALDFRVPGVPVRKLRSFVEHRGSFGVGIYPQSDFVHVDLGPRRRWGGL